MVAADFKEKVISFSAKLLMVARQYLKDEDKAKDAVQDVFLKLWNKRDRLSDIDNLEGYVLRMTRNRCIDILRSDKIVPLDDEYASNIEDKKKDVQSQLELSELAREIKCIIDQLPELQRRVMTMRDLEHYTFDEIEEKMNIKRNAIRVNLSRARHRVRLELQKKRKHGTQRNRQTNRKIL